MNPEELYVLDMVKLGVLRDLRRRRDEQAFIAGCALLEHEKKRAEIYKGTKIMALRNLRLGALYHELLEATGKCHRLVKASEYDEGALGTAWLQEMGIDPSSGEFRFDIDNGVVLRLENAEWLPLKRAAL